jgi:hypothetical protein
MNAAGSVMKAAGKWMKRRCTVRAGRFRNDMKGRTALTTPLAIGLSAVLKLAALQLASRVSRQQQAAKSAEQYLSVLRRRN